MIDILGWISTALILFGYYFNAQMKRKLSFISWIVGDIGWVVYDIFIANWSHLVLSAVIIAINVYGMYKISLKNMPKNLVIVK